MKAGVSVDRSNTIELIKETYTKDAIGQPVATETTREVFCNIRSVTRTEFFAAGEKGLFPELVATMFIGDYEDEKVAELSIFGNTKRYGIYRTYIAGNDLIELYLERKQGDA